MKSLKERGYPCEELGIKYSYAQLEAAVKEFKERYFDREIYCKELGESIFDEIFGVYKEQ